MDRRQFIGLCGTGVASLSLPAWSESNKSTRLLKDARISPLGLNTAQLYRLGEFEAITRIHKARQSGFTCFDTAAEYGDGFSEEMLGKALNLQDEKTFIISKTLKRDKQGALRDLHQSLKRLNREYLDLWMIHDLRTPHEWHEITSPGGMLEAAIEAKRVGKIRYLGLTAHRNPELLRHAIRTVNFDAAIIPLQPIPPHRDDFTSIYPTAKKQNTAIIGMNRLTGYSDCKNAAYTLQSQITPPLITILVGCE